MKAIALVAAAFASLLLALPRAEAVVLVNVNKIYASSEREFVDPKLKDLEPHFSRFGMFTSFKAEGSESLAFDKEGDARTVPMPGGKELTLVYRGASKGYIKLRFELGDLKMNVRIHDGGLFFHSGVPHQKGRLVLAIRAKSDGGAASDGGANADAAPGDSEK